MSEADTVPDRNFSFVRLPARFKARKHVGRADFRGYRRPKGFGVQTIDYYERCQTTSPT